MKSFFYFLVRMNFWQAWLVIYHALFSDPHTVELNKFEASECVPAILKLPIGVKRSILLKDMKKLANLVPRAPADIPAVNIKWCKKDIDERLSKLIETGETQSRCLVPKYMFEGLEAGVLVDFKSLEIYKERMYFFSDDDRAKTPYECLLKTLATAWLEVKIKSLDLPPKCPKCEELILEGFTIDLKGGYLECQYCKIDLPLKGKLPKTLAALNKDIEAYESEHDRAIIERVDYDD